VETLKNKKVVIIGGTSGIGLATAKLATLKGANIIIASSNQQRVDNALQELPNESKGYAVDATNESQLKILFEKIGSFDHLIFTAGEGLILENIADASLETAQKFFNVRYWGAFTAVK
jgi:NAD(P)-dependent dehydrogenase (short-subunit alcohol dehydrogenase family)